MNDRNPSERPHLTWASMLGVLLMSLLLSWQFARAETPHPPTGGMTGEMIFSKLLDHSRLQQERMQGYSVTRTYRVKNDKGNVRAETTVLLEYRAPASKEFTIVSESGSGYVRRHVFEPLMDSEVETASGTNRRDSSISPANYTFQLLGEDDVD